MCVSTTLARIWWAPCDRRYNLSTSFLAGTVAHGALFTEPVDSGMIRTEKHLKKPNTSSERKTSTELAPRALSVEALRWRCDADTLPFDTTDDVKPAAGVIGQDAAVEALRFGLETDAPGQNIFVRGLVGTGRLTLVRRLLDEIHPPRSQVTDHCYVHNFAQPEHPRLITLPAGQGSKFRREVGKLADFIRDDLQGALLSEGIKARRRAMDDAAQRQAKVLVGPLEEALHAAGMTLVQVDAGPVAKTVIFPVIEGRAVPPEEFEQLHTQGEIDDAQYKALRDAHPEFERQLADVNEKVTDLRQRHGEAVAALLEKSARSIIEEMVRHIQTRFDTPCVRAFLDELVDDVVSYRLVEIAEGIDFTPLYRVNVVSEHTENGTCPVIIENTPTMRNLIGTFEADPTSDSDGGQSHMGIRAGSLLRADGGYLILEDRDVLNEPGAWKALKRTLRTGRLEITPPDAGMPGWTPALKPQPIDIKVKVVLLGDPMIYFRLDERDPHFPQLFKVLADFDDVIPRDETGISQYATVLARIAREDKLPAFDRTAVAALIEHGARIAARSGKLTARFGRLADIAREAAYLADKSRDGAVRGDSVIVTGDHVRNAVRRGKQRANLPSRRFREFVADGTIRVETSGSVVGQINGLAVMQAGPMVYGFPTRVTATIGPGTAGVINIEREARLSGAIHTKGFYILGGLLRYLLRTDHPLAFAASIALEQSYGSIDGDSASGAEICCLLSALTDIPLRQDVAMTGAIDQFGHILAVGAVNEKVEGFFDACHDLGMTGTQGVIIPQANAGDFVLRHDVVEACASGTFHVYAVQTVHEALHLLTGRPAGVPNAGGRYPKGSVLRQAVDRAREYWLKAAPPSARAALQRAKKTGTKRAAAKKR